jgi:hypothetical protein
MVNKNAVCCLCIMLTSNTGEPFRARKSEKRFDYQSNIRPKALYDG